uniref:Predicted protein n=1 Tax=Hordeum vulgare subsp. vulgare TaxID=112509 RepID=F2E4G6_HORVV|nr:predicted protein [Hordeum vulgare subsp. vulgare]
MAKKVIKKEIEEWLEGDVETALIEIKGEISDDKVNFCIGENEQKFSITFPKDYPKSKDKLFVFSEDSSLREWQEGLNNKASKSNIKISDLLTEAAEKFLEMGEDEEEEQEEFDEDDDLGIETEVKKEKPKKTKEEMEIDNKEFLEIGSPTATMRLIRDLKAIGNGKPDTLGFSATPVVDTKSGLENLYHWNVKFFGFEKGSEIAKDMEQYKKKTGQDSIQLELRFSKDYPFAPPFVRVVRPRFAFRTGHVTVGGSICMELLTNSGWNSTNDIESILIQIRSEMLSGGARLDHSNSTNYEYSESEAWDAFYRAASTHGWKTDGLNKNNYSLVSK